MFVALHLSPFPRQRSLLPIILSLFVNALHLFWSCSCEVADALGLDVSCAGSVGLELAAGKDGKAVGSEVGQYTVWHSRKLSCHHGPCMETGSYEG